MGRMSETETERPLRYCTESHSKRCVATISYPQHSPEPAQAPRKRGRGIGDFGRRTKTAPLALRHHQPVRRQATTTTTGIGARPGPVGLAGLARCKQQSRELLVSAPLL